MANLTISVDDQLLKRARVKAAQNDTSVNALLRAELERYAGAADDDWVKRFLSKSRHVRNPGGASGWSRDELYRERMEKATPK